MNCLGSRLKIERKRLGLTQAKLGEIGGVAANAQGHYEKGKRIPKADYLQKIGAVGIDTKYVLLGMPSPVDDQVSPTLSNHPVNIVIRELGDCLYKTATTIAAIATMNNSTINRDTQMREHLKLFELESLRFIEHACAVNVDPALNV